MNDNYPSYLKECILTCFHPPFQIIRKYLDELPKPGEKAEIILQVEQEAPKDIEIIISPPEFVQPIVDIEVAEGDDVRFKAQVTGSQPITITWYQETKPIQV